MELRLRTRPSVCLGMTPTLGTEFMKTLGADQIWETPAAIRTATRYGLDGPGIESRWKRDFSARVQTGPGAHPASHTMSTASFPGVKGRGVDHPPYLAPRLKKE